MRRPRRIRRLEPDLVVQCNGGDHLPGCAFFRETHDRREARRLGTEHAFEARHEVVIVDRNDGLVIDGRPR